MAVTRLTSPFGEVVLKAHPLFNRVVSGSDYDAVDSWMAVLDMAELRYRHLRNSDTKYTTNLQSPGQDQTKAGYLTAAWLTVGPMGIPLDTTGEAAQFGDQHRKIGDSDFLAGAEIDRLRIVVKFCGFDDPLGCVVHVEEFSASTAASPTGDGLGTRGRRMAELTNHGRDHVRRLSVEIVARPVEIDRNQIDAVESVLRAIRIEHDAQRALGHAVGGVGFLGLTGPQVVLAEGNRAVLGVRAHRAHLDEFLDVPSARLLNQMQAHSHVGIEESSGLLLIRADAAHFGGQMNDNVRRRLVEEAGDILCVGKVVLA